MVVIKSTWSSVELNLYCVHLFWLNLDVSLTVKHYMYSFCIFGTLMSSLVLYCETGKCSQRIAQYLHSTFLRTQLFLNVERNLIRADFDHMLGDHF